MEEKKPIHNEEEASPPIKKQQLNTPLTNETILPAVETTTETKQPSALNPSPSTVEDMEVHHHTHASHGKKKLSHYFWEFLMLFLAVFCGFLAEYQLMHKNERDREGQFI